MGIENNIPVGWTKTTLGDVCENISRRFNFQDKETVVFVNTGDVSNGKFLHHNKISKEGLPGQAKKAIKIGDILYSEIRPKNKRFAIVDFDSQDYVVSTKFMVLKRNDKIDLDFFYLFLKSNKTINAFQSHAEARSGTFPQITFDTISLDEIILPPLSEQKAIAKVLNAFDDKIELLQAQNKTLETMAQTIFKEWFGKYQIGDELPDGWSVGDIYNVLDVQYGYPFKSKLFNENKEGLPLIRIRDIRKGVTGFYTTEAYEKEYLISSGDVLAGMDAVFQPYLWSGGKGLLNQRACRFIPKDFVSRIFVFEFMKPHLSFYEKTKVGTTVIHLGKGDLDFIETVIPDKESLLKFKDLTTPIEEKIINNQQEIQSLIKTRDTLLPKLMSGQVRVNNIKQTANA